MSELSFMPINFSLSLSLYHSLPPFLLSNTFKIERPHLNLVAGRSVKYGRIIWLRGAGQQRGVVEHAVCSGLFRRCCSCKYLFPSPALYRSVEFDPTAQFLVSSSFDKTVAIYDLLERKQVNKIQTHTDRSVLSKFHPFYPFILSTSADCTARIYAPKNFLINMVRQ